MSDERPPDDESPKERADRELIELLNELRIVLPGVTVPSSYHRLRFRHGNKERMVRAGNRLAIAGIAASAVSFEAVVLLVTDFVLSRGVAIAAAAALFAAVAVLWYEPPLVAALRDRPAR